MSMFQQDPGWWDAQEARHRDRMRGGHSTSSLRAFDMAWSLTGLILKWLTSPIWLPISWGLKQRRNRKQRGSFPTDPPRSTS